MEALDELELNLIRKLNDSSMSEQGVILWACPVPYFGNVLASRIATVGINPSNLEFVNQSGIELSGPDRRFPTLASMQLESWSEATIFHARKCTCYCLEYFERNPYNGWFRGLDRILGSTGFSYYSRMFPACHLDLVPYATFDKWSALQSAQRSFLLTSARNLIPQLLAESPIDLMVLNGQTVVDVFSLALSIPFERQKVEEWTLARANGRPILGFSYYGELIVERVSRETKRLPVLGFNHNIQSSFGVNGAVRRAIQKWIGTKIGASL